ncbi:ABC transporter substrate-binding protein [Streptomyces daqingensis]|uniref:ABC transporter substrate-binding protein n=1 Tax=Streptomyces daqingensis TaxID=1472640 RepID=A0ABQ2MUM9_9ACTN|nr:ABC transporter substrate-binding protein [Streptomyces daqingensis]GGO57954.1 ABC transporter substrate-binding protein [Streptomyces daqingensis]
MSAIPRRLLPSTAVLAALTLVSGCGLGAKKVESGADATERGPITYAAGKDVSGVVPKLIKRWNETHPDEKATFIELPEDANAQRQQMIQNAQLKSDTFTVLSLDAVWTAEFAANRWIDEIPRKSFPYDKTLDPINGTVRYRGKYFAMPYASDGALLYYRKDLLDKAGIDEPPETWSEMQEVCRKVLKGQSKMSCYAGQFEKYEGLTVNFSEAVHSAGGRITDDKGNPTVNTPEAKRGLDSLVEGFRDGTMSKEAITYMEEPGRRAFEKGKTLFIRQWPSMYGVSSNKGKNNEVAGKFGVAPIPGQDGPGVSSLGGHNLALSSSARNKATALDFMRYMTSKQNSRRNLNDGSLAPVYTDLYDDPEMRRKFPWLPVLKKSILHAEPRPRVVQYGDATTAIQDAAYAALTGKKSSSEALRSLQKKLRALTP